jgi:hypothetical protein
MFNRLWSPPPLPTLRIYQEFRDRKSAEKALAITTFTSSSLISLTLGLQIVSREFSYIPGLGLFPPELSFLTALCEQLYYTLLADSSNFPENSEKEFLYEVLLRADAAVFQVCPISFSFIEVFATVSAIFVYPNFPKTVSAAYARKMRVCRYVG